MLINKQKTEAQDKFVGKLSEELGNLLKNKKFIIEKKIEIDEEIKKKFIEDLKKGKLKIIR